MRWVYYLLLFFLTTPSFAGSWIFKRKIGAITVWKPLVSTQQAHIRATSKFFNNPSKLNSFKNKKKLVKNFEIEKKKILESFGITNWKATSYQWKKDKYLLITGTYYNRSGVLTSFKEKHIFYKDSRALITIINEKNNKISDKELQDLEAEVVATKEKM